MRPRAFSIAVALVAPLTSVACTLVDDGDVADDRDAPAIAPEIPAVTVPPERLSPFCQAMIDLSDRLDADPDVESRPLILETYAEIAEEVPAEIADDFGAVLADLRSGGATAPTTTPITITPGGDTALPDPGAPPSTGAFDVEEGRLPGDEPAQRLNAYVEFACRDSVNNPGPPPTAPLDEIELDETSDR